MEVLILAMLAGFTYSVIWWASKKIDPTKVTEKFDGPRFVVTIAFGALVGLVFIYGQVPIKEIWEGFQFLIFAAITASFEKVTQTIWRKLLS